jgi:hypothetical protein
MDIMSILALISKGLTVIQTLEAAGQAVAPAIKVVTNLVTGAQAGTVTPQQLTDTETTLDQLMADFNTPIV